MTESHLTLELLRAVDRGARSAQDLAVVALSHLLELCPRCREVFETWRRTAGQGPRGNLASLYAEQGRLDQLEHLVEEIIPVFEAQNVHYEADNARQILEAARSSAEPPVH